MGSLLLTAGKSRYGRTKNGQFQNSSRANSKRDISQLHSEIEKLEAELQLRECEFTKTNDFKVLREMRILKKKLFHMKRKYV